MLRPTCLMLAATFAVGAMERAGAQVSITRDGGADAKFVDFSEDLERVEVSVFVGTLGKLKEGKRTKIDEKDAHLGTGNAVSRISGTRFFRVPVRTKIRAAEHMAGRKPGASVPLTFEMQLAKLPDGSEQRQLEQGLRAKLQPGLTGLWVVEKVRRKSKGGYQLLHVLPMPAIDASKSKREVAQALEDFVVAMRDVTTINQRIAALREALADAEVHLKPAKGPGDPEAAAKALSAALEPEVKLEDPESDRLVAQHLRPWEQRVRRRLAEVEKLLGGPSPERPTSRPNSSGK